MNETIEAFTRPIRNYWHVENKVHYGRDVTQGKKMPRGYELEQFLSYLP